MNKESLEKKVFWFLQIIKINLVKNKKYLITNHTSILTIFF